MAIWEVYAPRRFLTLPKLAPWVNNLRLVVINSLLLRLLFPAAGFVSLVPIANSHARDSLGMTIGILKFRDRKKTDQIIGMLLLTLKGKISEYAINTRN